MTNPKTDKIILYLIHKSKSIDRIKLMKLMFLADYYDLIKKKLVSQKFIGNEFIIYNYGVFSFEVYKEFLKLLKEDKIVETKRILKTDKIVTLEKDLKDRIDSLLDRFDNSDGWKLVDKTLELLEIDKGEKYKYIGVPVDVILYNKGQ